MYLKFINELLQNSAQIAHKSFGNTSSTVKKTDPNQILTPVDIEISSHIKNTIGNNFSQHNYLDEEAGFVDKHSNFTWIVDPLDGTSNYTHTLPMYGIIVCLLAKNQPIAAGVALPYFKEIFLAEKGQGTKLNGVEIRPTKHVELKEALVAYGIDSHPENENLTRSECAFITRLLPFICNIRSSNSCFDIMQVVKGGYAAWMCQTSRIWDIAGPWLIITEAGGKCTDFMGGTLDFSNISANFSTCIASIEIHSKLQHIIHSV